MLRFAFLFPAFLAPLPVAAQSPPPAMLGVWAPSPESCTDRPDIVADSRTLIARRTIEDFVTAMRVRSWQQVGAAWRVRAIVTGEEGEGEPSGARNVFELRLLPDGRLSLRKNGGEPAPLVRCPPGVRVR